MKIKMFSREESYPIALEYCKEKAYDIEKLNKLNFGGVSDFGAFHVKNEVVPDGLMNDLATQPKIMLIVYKEDSKYLVEETEHTKEYFNS